MAIFTLFLLVFGDSVLGPVRRSYLPSICGQVRNKPIYPFMCHSNYEHKRYKTSSEAGAMAQAGEWTESGSSCDSDKTWQNTRGHRNKAIRKCIMLWINTTKDEIDVSYGCLQLRSPRRSENTWSPKGEELDPRRVCNWRRSLLQRVQGIKEVHPSVTRDHWDSTQWARQEVALSNGCCSRQSGTLHTDRKEFVLFQVKKGF